MKKLQIIALTILIFSPLLFAIDGVMAMMNTYPTIGGITLTDESSFSDMALYFFSLLIALGAVIMFFVTLGIGLKMITGGTFSEAKSRFRGALIGFVILLSTYLIANTINPELLRVKDPVDTCINGFGIKFKKTVETEEGEKEIKDYICIKRDVPDLPEVESMEKSEITPCTYKAVIGYSEPNYQGSPTILFDDTTPQDAGCPVPDIDLKGFKSVRVLSKLPGFYNITENGDKYYIGEEIDDLAKLEYYQGVSAGEILHREYVNHITDPTNYNNKIIKDYYYLAAFAEQGYRGSCVVRSDLKDDSIGLAGGANSLVTIRSRVKEKKPKDSYIYLYPVPSCGKTINEDVVGLRNNESDTSKNGIIQLLQRKIIEGLGVLKSYFNDGVAYIKNNALALAVLMVEEAGDESSPYGDSLLEYDACGTCYQSANFEYDYLLEGVDPETDPRCTKNLIGVYTCSKCTLCSVTGEDILPRFIFHSTPQKVNGRWEWTCRFGLRINAPTGQNCFAYSKERNPGPACNNDSLAIDVNWCRRGIHSNINKSHPLWVTWTCSDGGETVKCSAVKKKSGESSSDENAECHPEAIKFYMEGEKPDLNKLCSAGAAPLFPNLIVKTYLNPKPYYKEKEQPRGVWAWYCVPYAYLFIPFSYGSEFDEMMTELEKETPWKVCQAPVMPMCGEVEPDGSCTTKQAGVQDPINPKKWHGGDYCKIGWPNHFPISRDDNEIRWKCSNGVSRSGLEGHEIVECSCKLKPKVSECGSANKKKFDEAPTTGLCARGEVEEFMELNGRWMWKCVNSEYESVSCEAFSNSSSGGDDPGPKTDPESLTELETLKNVCKIKVPEAGMEVNFIELKEACGDTLSKGADNKIYDIRSIKVDAMASVIIKGSYNSCLYVIRRQIERSGGFIGELRGSDVYDTSLLQQAVRPKSIIIMPDE